MTNNITNKQTKQQMHSPKRVVRICDPSTKILVMGEARVGKTAIVNKLRGNTNDRDHAIYTSTQCVEVHQIMLAKYDRPYTIWDCSSNHKSTLQKRHIRGATSVILVCNLLIPFTQKQLWYWYEKVIIMSPCAKITVIANAYNLERELRDDYLVQFLHEFPHVGIHVINIRSATPHDILQIVADAV